MKCILLFLVINFVVVLVFSVVLNIVYVVMGMQLGSLFGLLVMVVVFGFGGVFILLLMLKSMVLCLVGGVVIDILCNEMEYWLLEMVCC